MQTYAAGVISTNEAIASLPIVISFFKPVPGIDASIIFDNPKDEKGRLPTSPLAHSSSSATPSSPSSHPPSPVSASSRDHSSGTQSSSATAALSSSAGGSQQPAPVPPTPQNLFTPPSISYVYAPGYPFAVPAPIPYFTNASQPPSTLASLPLPVPAPLPPPPAPIVHPLHHHPLHPLHHTLHGGLPIQQHHPVTIAHTPPSPLLSPAVPHPQPIISQPATAVSQPPGSPYAQHMMVQQQQQQQHPVSPGMYKRMIPTSSSPQLYAPMYLQGQQVYMAAAPAPAMLAPSSNMHSHRRQNSGSSLAFHSQQPPSSPLPPPPTTPTRKADDRERDKDKSRDEDRQASDVSPRPASIATTSSK